MRHVPDRQLGWLIAFFAASYLAAGLGSLFTFRSLDSWYRQLRKPRWTPPDRVFGPVWTILYAQMALSAWLLKRASAGNRTPGAEHPALYAWATQLILNTAWSIAFFGRRSPGAGLAVIVPLWLTIAITVSLSARVSKLAAALLVPYLAWTSFAGALNWSVWRLNLDRPRFGP